MAAEDIVPEGFVARTKAGSGDLRSGAFVLSVYVTDKDGDTTVVNAALNVSDRPVVVENFADGLYMAGFMGAPLDAPTPVFPPVSAFVVTLALRALARRWRL